ncbi:DNA repair protein RadA [Periweissella beninensis]|uniref:DNA repair protein RadA n=1 Tax=Periweissella beninensis TaxID=504936 RepID=A0ABT0VGB1_9LACO|nr:DNA repair protein RadA [Periweissella beninensis]MBM7544605.1 DNA repair protein RadA/Sms [Periweissella beninensis]MCM2436872.1 DNA repair protein RadA [Periweissella beninensis]MCT4395870.1 DNA repair protein RadA [Periweissella beninensis]
MAKVKTQFICANCGYISPKYLGRCPNCGEWGTLTEEKIQPEVPNRQARVSLAGQTAKVEKIDTVKMTDTPRVKVSLNEVNRVLGGGVVPGSMVLIGGDPGIGKSTLLLQLSGQLADTKGTVLYVSGEESASQIKMRADRLGVGATSFYLFPETDMSAIRKQIDELKPNYVIIDSIQTMQEPDVQSAVGSVSQVREVTAELLQIAKTNNITVFIVGHVTKEGALAGPKMLEHMVDTVLYFEGDKHHAYRILRAVKNRFGSTNELGIFEMATNGLKEVANPSQIFLEERLSGATGSAIVVSMEGTRPILVEIQALITPSVFGNAQRTATGLDRNRVALIMAVLEKRANLLLQNQDAFLKAAGGVKLDEPAIDLAIAIAVASSYRDKETAVADAFIGELGLTGEIRSVSRIEERVLEAQKLGFKRVFIPKNNLQGWQPDTIIEVIGVATITEALKYAFTMKKTIRKGVDDNDA